MRKSKQANKPATTGRSFHVEPTAINSRVKLPSPKDGLGIAVKYLTDKGLLPRCEISQNEVLVANKVNFLRELSGLNIYHKEGDYTFGSARLQVFKAVTPCLLDETNLTVDDFTLMHSDLKVAAMVMYKVDGMKGLNDTLIWHFIPREWRPIVEAAFSGFGE